MQLHPVFRPLQKEDCQATLLDKFERYQSVQQSWQKKDGQWILADTPFIERWTEEKKQSVTNDFMLCIETGGVVIGCFMEEALVGWACVGSGRFGSAGQYVNLEYLHVSYGYRNLGLGKELFRRIKDAARNLGATRLYISGMPAKETQAFYKSVGCREAEEVDPVLLEKEPFDCHLECTL